MAHTKTSSWHLENVEEAHKANPRTFHIPSRAERSTLRPGLKVRLIFILDPPIEGARAERMWVTIDSVTPKGYVGRLDSEPVHAARLSSGDTVFFGPEHVATVLIPRTDPMWVDESLLALVSTRVTKEHKQVGYLYREAPDHDRDSGWRVFHGNEADDWANDPDHITVLTLEALLGLEDSLYNLLHRPPGSAFERRPGSRAFTSITRSARSEESDA